uniref:Uncharacterized protein n=1 Tax=Anopheles farauti TaxID=69004 RepID=A0A2C9GW73_9DIPT
MKFLAQLFLLVVAVLAMSLTEGATTIGVTRPRTKTTRLPRTTTTRQPRSTTTRQPRSTITRKPTPSPSVRVPASATTRRG